MDATQFFETTVADRDSRLVFRFITVPARALTDQEVLRDLFRVTQVLELEPGPVLDTPSLLPDAIAALLVSEGQEQAYGWLEQLRQIPRGLGLPLDPNAVAFSQYLAFAKVVPFESSPIELGPLISIIQSGSGVAIGAAAGFVAGGGSPLVLITVPAGMILGGTAAGLAKALEDGLYRRLVDWITRK